MCAQLLDTNADGVLDSVEIQTIHHKLADFTHPEHIELHGFKQEL